MHKSTVSCTIGTLIFVGISFLTKPVYAADVEDFVAGVSSTRVTINPASVGAINRFHLQYDGSSYNALDTTGQTFVSDPEYKKGNVTQGELTFVWPGFFLFNLSLGLAFDGQQEQYKSNNINLAGGRKRSVTEKFTKLNRGILVATPFEFGTFGIRLNRRSVFINKDVNFTGAFANDSDISIDGIATVDTIDYGLIIPNILDLFDVGVTLIPSRKGLIKFDYKKSGASLNATEEFEEPGQTIFGIGVSWDLVDTTFQVLGETGSIAKVDKNFLGEAGESGSVQGGLIRFAWPPLIDISYGVKREELASLAIQRETWSLNFPIFIGTIKYGQQTIKLLDNNDTIAEVTVPKFSFNVQFGGPRSALTVKPKTKKINFIDRL